MGNPGPDIFTPIDDDVAPPQIERRSAHPVPRTGICGWPGPLDTNKFYANFFLGSQTQATWVHPYSLQWSKGQGNTGSWGMSISHVEAHQLGLAPGDPPVQVRGQRMAPQVVLRWQYYINALGIQSMILSAAELGPATQLTTHEHDAFSVRVDLAPRPNAPALLWIPCVQGMGFVTGVYDNATPVLGSSVLFRSISPAIRNGRAMKYRVVTEDNCNWLIYVTPHSPYDTTEFHMQSNSAIVAPPGFQGIIQVAKNPTGRKGEKIYDLAAGSYATSVTINGRTKAYEHHVGGTYTLEWEKAGSGPLLMYALPHHVHSFDDATAATKTGLELRTTTKGMATAILGDRMTMVEPCLPTTMGFAPWSPTLGERTTLSKQARDAVNEAATHELGANMTDQCNLNSMYFSGKGLAKFATLVYVASELARNAQLAASGLARLKTEFARFVANAQQTPLVYDEAWRGVVSTAGYADAGADFGNSYYNDHHFHYGYFVYTAAVIAFVDPAWLHQGTNKAWVQMLVKDYANADPQLQHGGAYPFSRAFDWWHGHSWAKVCSYPWTPLASLLSALGLVRVGRWQGRREHERGRLQRICNQDVGQGDWRCQHGGSG